MKKAHPDRPDGGGTEKPNPLTGASIDITQEVITPEMAKEYLALNMDPNRAICPSLVDRYKRDMLADRWRLSGEAIRFNKNGELIDGQHRLSAAIRAGVPFTSLVIRGLDNEVINVIDSGKSRSASDVLKLHRYSNTAALAAAARWLMVMRDGFQSLDAGMALIRPSNEEILALVHKHPQLEESCAYSKPPKGVLPSLLAAIHYVGTHHLRGKEEFAEAFVRVFVTGEPHFASHDPALKLREMNLTELLRGHRPTQKAHYLQTIYAWNAFSDNRAIMVWKCPETITVRGLDPKQI